MILLVVCFANSDGRVLTSKASFKVNLLNDDTYRWIRATIIVSSFEQTEQGAQYIKEILNLLNEESVSRAHSGRGL